jgi:hypothetical protein
MAPFLDTRTLETKSRTCKACVIAYHPHIEERMNTKQAIKHASEHSIRYLHKHGQLGQIPVMYIAPNIVRLLIQCGAVLKSCHLRHAINNGYLDMATSIYDSGIRCNGMSCMVASEGGHIEMLRWLRSWEPPCPWDEWTCAEAAKGGHIETLRWLRSQNPPCPWNEYTCIMAAGYNQIETLRWLRSQNPPVPWDERVSTAGACSGDVNMLKWLISQGCPWDIDKCRGVAKGQTLKWIKNQMGLWHNIRYSVYDAFF